MANPATIQDFERLAALLEAIDRKKIVRSEVGSLAFKEAETVLDDLRKKIQIARISPQDVSQQAFQQFNDGLGQLTGQLQNLENVTDQNFAQQTSQFRQQSAGPLEAIRQAWPAFVAVALDRSDLLSDSGTYAKHLRDEAAGALTLLKATADNFLTAVRNEADSIEKEARLTAAGISVEAAQKQFDSASKTLQTTAYVWIFLSTASFAGFVLFSLYLLKHPPQLESSMTTRVIVARAAYLTAVRLTILTAIGALSTFLVKMAKAYLHMSEYNNHRRRVANSMSAFVASASTREQRDIILVKLVDSVVAFGESGILEGTKELGPVSTTTIEAIMKGIPQTK